MRRGLLSRAPRLAALLFGLAVAVGAPADAAVFVVNSTATDVGVGNPANCPAFDRNNPPATLPGVGCTLRDAVAAANALTGDDEIVINLPGAQQITLATTLVVNEGVDINAPPIIGAAGGQLLTSLLIDGLPSVTDLIKVTAGTTQLLNIQLATGNVVVDPAGAGVTFFQNTGTNTFAQDVTGAGTLTKDGGGTLVLTGTNSFTGGTEISEGILQGNTASIPGGTQIAPGTVHDDAKLVFNQADTDAQDFFGVISGTGSLEKIGTGTLFLHTPNSYTGGTTVTAGTLIGFAAGTAGSLQGDIVDNAKLVFQQDSDGEFPDDISGSGSVAKDGAGTLTLSGSNSFTGGLKIDAGVVIGNTGSIPGNVDIAASAQLIFDQATDGTHAGNITGGGGSPPGGFTLIKRGAGMLNLTGTNSYAGGTLVEAGILQGTTQSLQGQIQLDSGSRLAFAQDFDGTFTGQIAGAGILGKGGNGALTFTQSLGFTPEGATVLSGGRLVIGVAGTGDGTGTTLPGDLEIQGNSTLAGVGSVLGHVDVTSGSRVAPGGAAGSTLSVGSIDFQPGSRYQVDASNAVADRLAVTGAATLSSAVALDVTLGSLDRTTTFDQVILSAGSLPGGSDIFTLDQQFAFFTPSLVSDANDIRLVLTPNGESLPSFATTRNQLAVGTALEEALAAPTHDADLDTVFGALGGLSPQQISRALDQMAGEQLTEFATTRLAISDRFQTSLQDRIRGVAWSDREALLARQTRDAGGPVLAADPVLDRTLPGLGLGQGFAPAPAPIAIGGQQSMGSVLDSSTNFHPLQGESGLGGWIDGYGLFGKLEGDSNSADLDYTIGGFSLGVDYLIAKRVLVGAAAGYAYSTLDFNGLPGDETSNTGQGGLYAGYITDWLRLGLSGRFGYSAMKTTRDIDFMGRQADGDFAGWDAGARAEAAVDLVKLGGVEIQPLASLGYTHIEQDSFDESGANSLNLQVDQQTIDSAESAIGARIHGLIQLEEKLWFHPELTAVWQHELGDRDRELDARIGGTPGAVYTVRGAKPAADAGVFGVRWTVVSAGRLHVFADYDVTLSSSLLQQGVSAGLKVVW